MLAAGADVPYVQAQVGHTDAKLTLEIYALVLKRRDRASFAEAFDSLMRDAIRPCDRPRCQSMGFASRLVPVRTVQRSLSSHPSLGP